MLARHAPCSPPHAFLVVLAGSQQNMAGAVEYLRAHPVPGAMYNTPEHPGDGERTNSHSREHS